MKLFKWILVISVTVAATCVLMSTFMQDEFLESVPAMVFSWDITEPVPIYVFAAAAFGIGLLIGFLIAAYYFVKGQAAIHGKNKEIRRLEDNVKQLRGELEQARDKITRSQKAVGDKPTRSQKVVGEKDLLG